MLTSLLFCCTSWSILAAFERNAEEFSDYLSSLLTKTITEHPLRPIIRSRAAFISFRGAKRFGERPRIELGNGCRIQVSQIILPNPEHPRRKVTTAEYQYSLLLGPDSKDWLLRYEYVPEQVAKKRPVAHVHFNGTSEVYNTFNMPEKKALPKLHCPTGRLPLEDFIEYLITEFNVPTKSGPKEALAFLAENREKFYREKRTRYA